MRTVNVFLCCLAASAVFLAATSASAVQMNVATSDVNPDSQLTIKVTLQGNEVGNSGPLDITGSAQVETAPITSNGAGGDWTTGTGDGWFAYISSEFYIEDTTFIVDLGIVQLTAQLDGVGMSIVTSGGSNGGNGVPVTDNEWNLDTIGAPDSMEITLNKGHILISGAIDADLDLESAPVGVTLADLLTLGIGGTADNRSVSNVIPTIAIDVGADLLGAGLLFAELDGNIYIHVPEPSSFVIVGLGLVGFLPLGLRRFRRRK